MQFKQLAAAAVLLVISCNQRSANNNDTGSETANQQFAGYSARFTEALWKQFPDWAASVGYHKYDSVLVVPDSAAIAATRAFVNAQLDSLQHFKPDDLSAANKTDYYLIRNTLQETRFNNDTLKSYHWDPSGYNVGGSFAFILNENYAPLAERLHNIGIKLGNVPAYYAAAKKMLINPVKELQELAIEQNEGSLSVFETDLPDSVNKATLPNAEKALIKQRAAAAIAAIKDYAAFLKKLQPAQPRSFRLGKDLYAGKFTYNIQSAFTASQIFDSATARKKYVQHEMTTLSKQLWPKYFGSKPMPADPLELVGNMIDTLSVNHATKAGFQDAISAIIPKLVAFIKQKNLLYLDSTKPLVVRKEPAYMAGVAGASISAPGPYDKGGNTYYNVGSILTWPDARAESYLREYNDYILQILDIHEAIPGHYTQLVYANRSPSIIKSVLGNGAMIEGWAVYTEQMMLENGYNESPEMWLMWYKWHLRTVCNTILDYSVHAGNMTHDEAMHLLTKEAFQQQEEAEGKWRRVSVTSVQLTSYYTGYKEIYDLREAYKKQLGDKFNLKTFHEKFLGYGSAPVKYIRELMLGK